LGSRITLHRPGVVPYDKALAMQHRLADDLRGNAGARRAESLILLEHPPTYTFGVRGKREHLLTSVEHLRARGAAVVQADRGGDVTFHGPGQIVGYPILDLRARGIGPATYVCSLEKAIISALSSFGIDSRRVDGRPGVWTGDPRNAAPGKIAAIGVRVSRGVTTHGFALNVNTDLNWFQHIIPCGLPDITITSMRQLAGRAFSIRDVEEALIASLARVFRFDEVIEPANPTRGQDTCQTTLPLSTKMEKGPGDEVTVGR
jgi:lipoate-protein ligase B